MNYSKKNKYFSEFQNISKALFPENKKELYLLICIMAFYFSYCIVICFLIPEIIQGPPFLSVDTYFSFDNKLYYHATMSVTNRHPLIKLIITPIAFIANLCNYIIGPSLGKRLFICFFCSFLVSSSILYIYKYLHHIIKLKGYIKYIITLLFVFFSTNMILCFTIETYTLSLFLLSFSVYYGTLSVSQNKKEITISSAFLAFILGGITITNSVKPLIPLFFSRKNSKSSIIKTILCTLGVLIFIILIIEIMNIESHENTMEFYNGYSSPHNGLIISNVISLFFGNPILLGHFFSQQEGVLGLKIVLDSYHYWWQYCTIGIILILVTASIISSYNNKFVQLLCALFLIDITIHIIMKFGIEEPYIYGAHWVYLIPLFLGWLYVKFSAKSAKIYTILISLICIVVMTNNLIKLYEFINLASYIYPQ